MYIYSYGDLPVCYEFLVPWSVDFRYVVGITRIHIIVVFPAAVMHRLHIFVVYQSYICFGISSVFILHRFDMISIVSDELLGIFSVWPLVEIVSETQQMVSFIILA